MKLKIAAVVLAFVMGGSCLMAQTIDPWIKQTYNQLYGRNPTVSETDIRNYNNGKWSGYCELVGHIASYNRYRSGDLIKGDPWIFQAYCELYSRAPISLELNIGNYNGGSWSSYAELKNFIQQYQSALTNSGIQVIAAKVLAKNGGAIMKDYEGAVFKKNGKVIAVSLLAKNEGKMVAAGGGNVEAFGAGNLVGNDGAGLIGLDGSTLSRLPGANISTGNYNLKSGNVIRTAGKSALVFQ